MGRGGLCVPIACHMTSGSQAGAKCHPERQRSKYLSGSTAIGPSLSSSVALSMSLSWGLRSDAESQRGLESWS